MPDRSIEDEILEGYLDGLKGEPEPNGNRSAAYVHGFQNARDDKLKTPRASALTLAKRAKEIMAHPFCEPESLGLTVTWKDEG